MTELTCPLCVDPDVLRRELGYLSDIARNVFTTADPLEMAHFYGRINLATVYHPQSRTAEASATLEPQLMAVGGEICVRGGT